MWSTLAKKNENDKIYWTRNLDEMESVKFTFDKERFFNLNNIRNALQKSKMKYLIKKIQTMPSFI